MERTIKDVEKEMLSTTGGSFIGNIGSLSKNTDKEIESETIMKSVTSSVQKLPNYIYATDELGCVAPKINREQLALLVKQDETHSASIALKVFASAGKGYKFMADNNDPKMKKLIKWAKNPTGKFGYTLTDLIMDRFRDMYIYENNYMEIVSSRNREPKVYRANPATIFIKPEKNANGIPISGSIDKYYQIVKGDTNTGQYSEFMPYSGKSDGTAKHYMVESGIMSEVDPFYGTPTYLPILKYIVENNYISDFNSTYFKQGAKISYALLITGHEFTETEETKLKSYTDGVFVGLKNAHKMLTLAFSESDAKIDLKPLTKGFDASFMELRRANRDAIALGNMTPSKILGIASGSNIGGGSEDISAMKKWLETVILPMQNKEARLWNLILEEEFGINPEMRFNTIDITNEKDDAIMNNMYFNMIDEFGNRALDIAEIRERQGFPVIDMKDILINEEFMSVEEKHENNVSNNMSNDVEVTTNADGKPVANNVNLGEDEDDIQNIAPK